MNAPANLSDAAFRAQHVGASEVAALFDCSPWVTRFELWHRKNGTIATPDFNAIRADGVPENERAYWGVRLEAAVIEAAKERYGYTDREQVPALTNGKGLGGHPDRRVICPERGPGVLEIKLVDWIIRKGWGDEPPLSYLLQSQTYQGLDGVAWGDVLVLVGGNKLERFQYDFRPKIYADIERRVAEFWQSVQAGKPPKPDYTRDGPAIGELYGSPDDTVIDLSRDNRAVILACEFIEAKARAKAAETEVEAAKAELIAKMGTNAVAKLDGYFVRRTPVKGSTYTVVRKDGFRFDVKESKQ